MALGECRNFLYCSKMGQQRKRIYQILYRAVDANGTLKEPFRPRDVRRIVPGSSYAWYFSFLAENCADNLPGDQALFIRVGRGAYRLNRNVEMTPDSMAAGRAPLQ